MYDEHFGRDVTEERKDETDEIEQRAGTDTEEWPEETEEQHVVTEEEIEGWINEMRMRTKMTQRLVHQMM